MRAKKAKQLRREAAQQASGAEDNIYQLRIALRYIRPPIWRRVQVPGSFTPRSGFPMASMLEPSILRP